MVKHTSTFVIHLLILFSSTLLYGQTFKQEGIASYYADKFEGRTTANGEKYRHSKKTAAHKTLPFGTILKVKNLQNGKEVEVRVNDRGPFVKGRIIDLSKSAAEELDFINAGIVEVEIVTIKAAEQSKMPYSTLDRPQSDKNQAKNELYSLNVEKKDLKGFGVQIGSFTEMVNLVELAARLQGSYHNKVFIQVSVIQDIKYYKVIVGELKSKEKAARLEVKVAQNYPDCFVIKF